VLESVVESEEEDEGDVLSSRVDLCCSEEVCLCMGMRLIIVSVGAVPKQLSMYKDDLH